MYSEIVELWQVYTGIAKINVPLSIFVNIGDKKMIVDSCYLYSYITESNRYITTRYLVYTLDK